MIAERAYTTEVITLIPRVLFGLAISWGILY